MPCGVGGGGTHRSWPGGRGGRPGALIPGEGWLVGGLVEGGGCKGFGSDGTPRMEQILHRILTRTKKKEKWRFLKDALWGGGGVPTGAGLVDGGVDQGPWLQERVGRVGLGCSKQEQVQGRGQGRVGLAVGGGGVQGLRLRGGRW